MCPKGMADNQGELDTQHQYVVHTVQRLAERIKQHVLTSIRKSNTARKQPPRICKNNKSKINFESAIRQDLIAHPECTKTYTDENFWIFGQARSFHLIVLESVYIKIQNTVLCKQKGFVLSLGLFK